MCLMSCRLHISPILYLGCCSSFFFLFVSVIHPKAWDQTGDHNQDQNNIFFPPVERILPATPCIPDRRAYHTDALTGEEDNSGCYIELLMLMLMLLKHLQHRRLFLFHSRCHRLERLLSTAPMMGRMCVSITGPVRDGWIWAEGGDPAEEKKTWQTSCSPDDSLGCSHSLRPDMILISGVAVVDAGWCAPHPERYWSGENCSVLKRFTTDPDFFFYPGLWRTESILLLLLGFFSPLWFAGGGGGPSNVEELRCSVWEDQLSTVAHTQRGDPGLSCSPGRFYTHK